MKRKGMTILSLLVALGLFLSACSAPAAPEASAPETSPAEPAGGEQPAPEVPAAASEPVTLHVGTTYIWDTANPAYGWYGYGLRYMLFDTLVEEQGISDFKPGLAESWSVSEDGLVYTFKIREGVTFHDGTPLDANAVAWSLNWTLENDIETFAFYIYAFEEIVALDATTLQVTLSYPVGNIEYLLMYVWILPESVWGEKTADEIGEFEDIAAATGSGPFVLKEWVEGEYLILESNPNYWRGKPKIDQIIYHEYATEDAVVQALIAGEIDVTEADIIPATAVQTLEGNDVIEVPILPSTIIDELIINSFEDGTQPASLNDPTVRLAMAYAIDQQQIINVAYLGFAEPATVIIPTSMGDWHNSDVAAIPFDLTAGNKLLDDAGFVDSNSDGIREYSDGTPLEYRLYGVDEASNARILEIISDGLSQIGISAVPTLMDEDSLIALYPAFDFDLVYWGWGLDPDPDFAMLIFTCDQREEGGWNDSGYCDSEFEEMYLAQGEAFERDARKEIIWDMQEKLFNDRPYIVLSYKMNIQAHRTDRFTGFDTSAGDLLWKKSLLMIEPIQ